MKLNRTFKRHVAEKNYRAYVGQQGIYDMKGAWQFMLLCLLGLRDHHHLLEIGCGSLRAARLFIPYLKPGRYCGLEAEKSMVELGLSQELGCGIVDVKNPRFVYNANFDLSIFGSRRFDFILAHGVILHLPSHEIAKMLKESARALALGGVFAANFTQVDSTEKSDIVYPDAAWYTQAAIKAAVKAAGLAYVPLHIEERRPRVKWFLAVHLGQKPTVLDDSIAGMINKYWYWERYGK